MTNENFLPAHTAVETQTARRNTLQCLKRGKAVPATPEERVRQRILNWLLNVKKWPVRKVELERSYEWVGDPNRMRVRPDIELLGDDDETIVVVECKARGVPLGGVVERQALEYAIKSDAKYVWVSNGDQHKFLVRTSKGKWDATSALEPLAATYSPPAVNFDFPDPNDAEEVDQYFERFFLAGGHTQEEGHALHEAYIELDENDKRISLSVHKLLFDVRKSLPFSHHGVHVLEDCGANMHEFANAGGGKWRGLYADYVAATSGRVEAMSLAVSTWGGAGGGIRLCVGVRKPGRSHHALQMNMSDCEWIEEERCWEVYHNGRMSRASNELVFQAVEESGAGA